MGLVHLFFSTVGKCLDAVWLLLDLNFLIVHTLVQTVLGVLSFLHSLPGLLLFTAQELVGLVSFCLVSAAEATSDAAHGAVTVLGGVALEGLLESLKMVGYLSAHLLLRAKEQLCRGALLLLEGCGIILSLLLYFTNTVVNFVLIAAQNVYLVGVSVWQTVSSPLQKVLELTLTCLTFLYSCLVGTSAFLWSPCKLLLDFVASLLHMFISIFILNVYGLLLTVAIALTTTAYLNPELTRQATTRTLNCIASVPALRRLSLSLRRMAEPLQSAPAVLRAHVQHLQRMLHHLYLLERGLWQQLARHSSQLGLILRTQLHRADGSRARGDGDPGEEEQQQRRGLPDGRAGDAAHQETPGSLLPSCSTDRPLKKQKSSSGKDSNSKPLPTDNLLTLLKEQEDRKKCVICQDCNKTVVLLPCRHLCLCRDCTNILLRQPIYQHNCPLCRHMILDTMDVYL